MKSHKLSSSYIIASTVIFVVAFVSHTNYVKGYTDGLL